MRRSLRAMCAVVILLPLAARGQPLADRLPADTVVYLGWAGADALGSKYDGSHLKAVLDASSFPKLVDEFFPQVLERLKQDQPEAREALSGAASLGRLWHRPCALAVTGLRPGGGGEPIPRVLFVCQAGDDAAELRRQLDASLRQGVRAAGEDGVPAAVKTFRSGDLVGWGIGYDRPEAALPDAAEPGKSLAGAAAFRSAMASAGSGPAVIAYVDAEAVVTQLNHAVEKSGDVQKSEMWPRVREALGIDGLKRIVFTQGFDGKEWGTQAFIEAPVPRKGLLAKLEAGPLGDDVLKAIPATATVAGVSRFDLAKLLDEVREAIVTVDETAGPRFENGLNQLSALLGFEIRQDLLAALGDEWAYFTDPMTGGYGATGVVLVNRLRDAGKAEQSLSRIEDLAGTIIANQPAEATPARVKLRQANVGGVKVHFVATPVVTPSWAVHGGNLYVGLYPQVVASAAAHGARGGASILDNKAFVALRQRLLAGTDAKASSVQFMDLPRTAPGSYSLWLMVSSLARFGDLAGVESPAMLFPTMDVLMQHLAPAGSVSWTDATGWHLRGVSPFPGSTVLAADAGGIMGLPSSATTAGILLPALERARAEELRQPASAPERR